MTIHITPYDPRDILSLCAIWNDVVSDGIAFPQEEHLGAENGDAFFAGQTFTGVAKDDDGVVVGLYILHPNNVGRCGHIANASYAVDKSLRGQHIGETLVKHSMSQAKAEGFRILQFNAVVASNVHALHLYKRLGFTAMTEIPGGFRLTDGTYENIIPHFIVL
ncbi:MAG: GNAT family N-acetyltransferase [Eubacteriaceae bacterium]|nr:GNAT family N-acetyltransferase [Eubacteriaceae bacterium]